MSHHFDNPTAIQDGRINLCDVYVFPGRPGHSVLVLPRTPECCRRCWSCSACVQLAPTRQSRKRARHE